MDKELHNALTEGLIMDSDAQRDANFTRESNFLTSEAVTLDLAIPTSEFGAFTESSSEPVTVSANLLTLESDKPLSRQGLLAPTDEFWVGASAEIEPRAPQTLSNVAIELLLKKPSTFSTASTS